MFIVTLHPSLEIEALTRRLRVQESYHELALETLERMEEEIRQTSRKHDLVVDALNEAEYRARQAERRVAELEMELERVKKLQASELFDLLDTELRAPTGDLARSE